MQSRTHVTVAVLLLAALICGSSALTIIQLPHFQTFDSWPTCYTNGVCYDWRCDILKGGWTNPEFHPNQPNPPFSTTVRHWWVINGQTPSNWDYETGQRVSCTNVKTGPCYDHTMGNATGRYMYIESSACFGIFYDLVSPLIRYTNSGAKVSFYYFMYGSNLDSSVGVTGRLQLDMRLNGTTTWTTIYSRNGQDQTNATQAWKPASVVIDGNIGFVPSPSNPAYVEFRFRARSAGEPSGTYWRGDIAIDDVLFTQNNASTDYEPYVDPPPPTNGTNNVPVDEGGDGLSDGEIAGIVVGIIGGLGLLCCLLLLLLLALLLIISPRKPGGGGGKGDL